VILPLVFPALAYKSHNMAINKLLGIYAVRGLSRVAQEQSMDNLKVVQAEFTTLS
jgi:hypothetical protein